MTKHVGDSGVVKLATLTIGELDNFTIDHTANVIKGRAAGEQWESANAVGEAWSGAFTCYLDEGDAGQAAAVVGQKGAGQFYTDGEASGKTEYSGTVLISGMSTPVPKGDFVMVTYQFTGDGALTGTVIA